MTGCGANNFSVSEFSSFISADDFLDVTNIDELKANILEALGDATFAKSWSDTNDTVAYGKSVVDLLLYISDTCDKYIDLLPFFDNDARVDLLNTVRELLSSGKPLTIMLDLTTLLPLALLMTEEQRLKVTLSEAERNIYGLTHSAMSLYNRSLLSAAITAASIIDTISDRPTIVDNPRTMNRSIMSYQELQYKIVRDYLISNGYSPLLLPETIYNILPNNVITINAGYVNVLTAMYNIINDYHRKGVLVLNMESDFARRTMSNGLEETPFFDAVAAYMNIAWFDEYLEDVLEGNILIRHEMSLPMLTIISKKTGKRILVYKYTISRKRTTNSRYVFNDEFLDALDEMGKFSKVLINAIPLYDYETNTAVGRLITPAELTGSFVRLVETVFQTTGAQSGDTLRIRLEIALMHDDPLLLRNALDRIFATGDRAEAALRVRDRLNAVGIERNMMNVLYSVYRVLFNNGNKSWYDIELAYLHSGKPITTRYNVVDTILGVINSAVSMNYLVVLYDSKFLRMMSSVRDRRSYSHYFFDMIDNINDAVVDNVNKRDLVSRYQLETSDGLNYTLSYRGDDDDGGGFRLAIHLNGLLLLDKDRLSTATIKLIGTDNVERDLSLMMFDRPTRRRLLDDNTLFSNNEQVLMSILTFVDEMLGTSFSLNDESMLLLYMLQNGLLGNGIFREIIMSGVLALLVIQLYNDMELRRMPHTGLMDYLANVNQIYRNPIWKTLLKDRGKYFYTRYDGLQLNTLRNNLVWVEDYAKARAILEADSVNSTTTDLTGNHLPNYSPLYIALLLRLDLLRVNPSSALAYNFFASRGRVLSIKRVVIASQVRTRAGLVKDISKMTLGELLYHSIVYGYLSPLFEDPEMSVYTLPTTYSDKKKVALVLLALSKMSIAGKTIKSFGDLLRVDELEAVVKKEINDTMRAFHQRTYDGVMDDYNALHYDGLLDGLDANTPLTEALLLQWLKTHTKEELMHAVDLYNVRHPNANLELKEETHYREYKDKDTSYLSLNELLLDIVHNGYDLDAALREFVVSLLENGVMFDVDIDSSGLSHGAGTNTITRFMNALLGRSALNWVKGNKMAIARVNGKLITTGSLPENIESFTLNPILKIYFLLDTLLSNNLRLARTGSEINSAIKLPDLNELYTRNKELLDKYLPVTELRLTLADVGMALSTYDANPDPSDDITSLRREYRYMINVNTSRALSLLHKRDFVAVTTMRPYSLNTINGLGQDYRIAVMDDVLAASFNYEGLLAWIESHNGAAWITPFTSRLENFSSLDMEVGNYVKKPIFFILDDRLGVSGLIKFDAVSIQNATMRDNDGAAIKMRDLFRKMTDIQWRDNDGIRLVGMSAVLGHRISFTLHILNGAGMKNRLFYYVNEQLSKEIVNFGLDNDVYYTEEIICDKSGTAINDNAPVERVYHYFDNTGVHYLSKTRLNDPGLHTINSLYELHQALGGIYSLSLNSDHILAYSEASNDAVTNYMIYVTDSNGRLILKDKEINMVANLSAVKKGAANINPASSFYDNAPLRYMIASPKYYGLLLDSDKSIDDADVAEMSQMVNALNAGGRLHTDVLRVYKMIGNLAMQMSKVELNAARMFALTGNVSALYDIVARMIVSTYRGSSHVGLTKAILNTIMRGLNVNTDHLLDPLKLCFSDPNIYSLVLPLFIGIINSKSVNRRFPGIANVLVPSFDMIMVYDIDGRICLFLDLVRMAAGITYDGMPRVNDNILIDTAEHNRRLVAEYLNRRLRNEPYLASLDRLDPTDGVICYNPLFDGGELYISLDDIQDYSIFKRDPVRVIAKYMHRDIGLNISDDGTITTLTSNVDNKALIQEMEALRNAYASGMILFKKAVNRPRNLRPAMISFEYEISPGLWRYMNVYDDYRIMRNIMAGHKVVEVLSLFDDLKRGIYRTEDGVEHLIRALRNDAAEAIMPNLYRTKYNMQGRSMEEIAARGALAFSSIPADIIVSKAYDIAFHSATGNHTYISFTRRDGSAIPLTHVRRVDVANASALQPVYTRVYSLDKANRLCYEIGREILRPDITYLSASDIFVDTLTGETMDNADGRYRNTDDGVLEYVQFVSLNRVKENTRKVLQFFIDINALRRVIMVGEDEDVAHILADIYRAGLLSEGLYVGISVNAEIPIDVTALKNVHQLIAGMTPYLADELSYDRLLSDFIRTSFADVINKGVINPITGDAVLYSSKAMQEALESYYNALAPSIFSSFMRVLDILAARIPGLGLQTFMKMRNVAFMESEVGLVYVSHWNIWLLGSDFDNDKAYMMALGTDANGRYVGWSSLFDDTTPERLAASEMLPMPVGKEYSFARPITDQLHATANEIRRLSDVVLASEGAEKIRAYAILLLYLEDNSVEKLPFMANDKTYHEIYAGIIAHESTTLPIYLLEVALKNFIASHILAISQDLRNMVNAYIPVDMVDLRTLGELIETTLTMLNPAFKFFALYQNLMGKDTVGVMANGMKAAMFWHYYLDDMVHGDQTRAADYGLFKFVTSRIAGRALYERDHSFLMPTVELTTLPNINIEGAENTVLGLAKRMPITRLIEHAISQYITAATDNAKELTLVKINATDKLAKMHLLLATLGFELNDIVAFMTSDVALFINNVSSDDVFHGVSLSVEDAISIARRDYTPLINKMITQGMLYTLLVQKGEAWWKNFVSGKVDVFPSNVFTRGSYEYNTFSDLFDRIRNIESMRDFENAKEDIDTFEYVYEASNEFSNFARLLSLNQGLPPTKEKLLGVITAFERAYQVRISLYNTALDRQIEEAKSEDEKKELQEKRIGMTNIDMRRFVLDVKYRKAVAREYNKAKRVLNIFDAVQSIPMYDALLELLNMEFIVDSGLSVRSRTYDKIYKDIISKYRFVSDDYLGRLLGAINDLTVADFLSLLEVEFPFMAGLKLMTYTADTIEQAEDGVIRLDSPELIASFKYLFENEFIPMLRRGEIYDVLKDNNGKIINILIAKNSALRSNAFITSLTYSKQSGRKVWRTDLTMDNIDVSPVSISKYLAQTTGLKALSGVYVNGVSVADWFALYNLVVNSNSYGRDRMTALFDGFIGQSSMITRYLQYVGNLDYARNYKNPFTLDYNLLDVMRSAAKKVITTVGQTDPMVILETDKGPVILVWSLRYRKYMPQQNMQYVPIVEGENANAHAQRVNNYDQYFALGGGNLIRINNVLLLFSDEAIDDTARSILTLKNLMSDNFVNIRKVCEGADCTVTIGPMKKNGKPYQFKITSNGSSIVDDSIIEGLMTMQLDDRTAIANSIVTSMSRLVRTRTLTLGALLRDGILANYTIDLLSARFPTISFPKGVTANILLVNNLRIGGYGIFGRVVNANGEEVFVVSNTYKDVLLLRAFLNLRNLIENDGVTFSEDSEYYKDLTAILNARSEKEIDGRKPHNIKEVMLEYLEHKMLYNDIFIDGNRNATPILSSIMDYLNKYGGNWYYDDDFINMVNHTRTSADNFKSTIDIAILFDAMMHYHKDILDNLGVTAESARSDFSALLSGDEKYDKPLHDMGFEDVKGLMDNLFSREVEFFWRFQELSGNNIILKSEAPSIGERYEIAYETVAGLNVVGDQYRGYKIYEYDRNGNTVYFISRDELTAASRLHGFESEAKAKRYIDALVEDEVIRKRAFNAFKYKSDQLDELNTMHILTEQPLVTGSIIRSLDFALDRNVLFNYDEQPFLTGDMRLRDFRKLVKSWKLDETIEKNIIDNLDNSEKVLTFLYRINMDLGHDRTDGLLMLTISEEIASNEAPVRYYYIASSDKVPGKDEADKSSRRNYNTYYWYDIIPTAFFEVDEAREKPYLPAMSLLLAIKESMQLRVPNVQVNLMTEEELTETLKELNINFSEKKAFIYKGQIYINTTRATSSDLLHEYAHLFLGMLKINPDLRERYELLLYLVVETSRGRSRYNHIVLAYEGSNERPSQMDMMEETFVSLFADYIMGRLTPDALSPVELVAELVGEAAKSFFNSDYLVKNMRTMFSKSIDIIFSKFDEHVKAMLALPNLDFTETMSARRKSNLISKMIRDGEIEEKCE